MRAFPRLAGIWRPLAMALCLGAAGCVNPPATLTAAFTATPTAGSGPLVVQFTDTSTLAASGAAIVAWSWDFGDPASGAENASAERHPTHTYRRAGTHTVRLTVTTAEGSATVTRANLITVTGVGPTASFTATPTTGPPGTLVRFTSTSDLGSGSSPTYLWDFGDPASGAANTSNLSQPTHRYSAAGVYTVSLTVGTTAGSDTLSRADLITIAVPPQPPVAEFDADATITQPGEVIQFNDRSVSALPLTGWAWDFGEPAGGAANTSAAQNPTHAYSAPGVYTVSLTAVNADGSSTRVREDYILVAESPGLAESVGHLVDGPLAPTSAVYFLGQAYMEALESVGADAAHETMDLAMARLIDTPERLAALLRRLDVASGVEVELPESYNPKRKADSPEACNGTTVLHVNGMNVLYTDFLLNLHTLGTAIFNDPQFAGEDIRVVGVYQRSATDAQQSFFGAVVCPQIDNPIFPRMAARARDLCRQVGGALLDLAEAGEQKLRDWALFPMLVPNPSQLFDHARITSTVVRHVRDERRNVVVVCHSQGNFFTRDVVNGLEGDQFGRYADSVAVVQVASPTSTMPQPTERFDICQDPVPRLSSEYSVATCYPWHVFPGGGFDIASHDFVNAYLAAAPGATTRPAMLRQIKDYHLDLVNPRGQSDLAVEPLEFEATPETPETPIAVGILPPDLGDLAWTATTSDPRIAIDLEAGLVRGGQDPADVNHIFVTVNDFTESFIGEVRIQNECVPGEVAVVQVRVAGDDLAIIDFDEIEGFGFLPMDGARYADLGVLFDSDMNLIVLAGNDDAVSLPNGICGADGRNFCLGTVGITFEPPVELVSFYVGDRERDRREYFQIEVLDASGGALDFVNSRIDRRFYTFAFPNIGRVVFHPSSDAEMIDSVMFRRRP